LREVGAGLWKDEVGSAMLDRASARQVADVPLPVSIASWDLGSGESQVIVYCLAGAQVAVLDDGEARACLQRAVAASSGLFTPLPPLFMTWV